MHPCEYCSRFRPVTYRCRRHSIHSICTDCIRIYYPNEDRYEENIHRPVGVEVLGTA